MKKIHTRIWSAFGLVVLGLFCSCSTEWLDVKPDQSLVVPTSLDDLEALLDNSSVMNSGMGLVGLATDDYEVTDPNDYNTAQERNAYIWASDLFEGEQSHDWNILYQQIFYANVVLDGLAHIDRNTLDQRRYDTLRGQALFFRAYALYQLVEQFALPYNEATAAVTPGVPIRLTADIHAPVERNSVKDAYDRILEDLGTAEALLPVSRPENQTKPSQYAVWAVLARIFLTLADYDNALQYADKCLELSGFLMDYNTLSVADSRPIAARGMEVIFYGYMLSYGYANSANSGISPELLSLYAEGDLRRAAFFRDRGNGVFTFKGNYTGSSTFFSGPSTAEMYLIRAECRARGNDLEGGLDDLNSLLAKRWDSRYPFHPIRHEAADDVLRAIFAERRKELVARGIRWYDLRRLNQEERFAITLRRTIDGVDYFLPPQDKRYAFPIPQEEIDRSGITQNER